MYTDHALIVSAVKQLRVGTPQLDAMLTARPDAVIIGGFIRDVIAGTKIQDVDIVLTHPSPLDTRQAGFEDIDLNYFNGNRIQLETVSVDIWNAGAATTWFAGAADSWIRHIVGSVPLTVQQSAYHITEDVLYVPHADQIRNRCVSFTRFAVEYGVPENQQAGIHKKLMRLSYEGWKLDANIKEAMEDWNRASHDFIF